MSPSVTTWMEGAVMKLDANDPRLAEQEAQRVLMAHIANMRRLPLHGRQEYLANVSRREGALARDRLAEAFAASPMTRRATHSQGEPRARV
jgi:hypothetical protein